MVRGMKSTTMKKKSMSKKKGIKLFSLNPKKNPESENDIIF